MVSTCKLAFLGLVAIPSIALAQFTDRPMPCGGCPIAIEEAMRRFQGMKAFFNADEPDQDDQYESWPLSKSCSNEDEGDSDEAPPYPPDGYYGNDLCDPRRAADLVRALADAMYGAGHGNAAFMPPIYAMNGEFPDVLEPGDDSLIDYQDLIATLPVGSAVTPDNYCDVFEQIWNILNQIKVVDIASNPDHSIEPEVWGKGGLVTSGGGPAGCSGDNPCWPLCFETVAQGYGVWKGNFLVNPNCANEYPPPQTGFSQSGWPYTLGWPIESIGIREKVLYDHNSCAVLCPENPAHWETIGMTHVFAAHMNVGTGPGRGSGAIYFSVSQPPGGHESNYPPIDVDNELHKYGSLDGPTTWDRKMGYQDYEFSTNQNGEPAYGVGTHGWQVTSGLIAPFKPAFEHKPDRAVRKGGGCSTCELGRLDATVDGVNVRLSLGTWESGYLGYLLIRGDSLVGSGDEILTAIGGGNPPIVSRGAAEMGTPRSIFVRGMPHLPIGSYYGGEIRRVPPNQANAGQLRQVRMRDVLADIVTISNHQYEIRFYKGIPGTTVGDYYEIGNASLEKKIVVEHAMDMQGLGNHKYDVTGKLTITENVGGTDVRQTVFRQTVTAEDWTQEVPDASNKDVPIRIGRLPNDTAWVTNDRWELATGTPNLPASRRETLTQTTTGTTRAVTRTVLDGAGQVASARTEYFEKKGWGEARTQIDEESPSGTRTTHWVWSDNGPRLVSVTHPNGNWERYTYDAVGRKAKVVSQYLDSSAASQSDADHRVVEYTYSSVELFGEEGSNPEWVVCEVESILGAEVSRKYTVFWNPDGAIGDHGNAEYRETTEIRCATLGAPSDLRAFLEGVLQSPDTSSHSMSHDRRWASNGAAQQEGSLAAHYESSGTLLLHQGLNHSPLGYGFDEWGSVSKRLSGPISPGLFPLVAHQELTVRDGRLSVNLRSQQGAELLSLEQDLQGTPDIDYDDIVMSRTEVIERNDVYGRATKVQHLDGTTESTTYDSCCGVTSRTDRQGIATTYVYDELKRIKEQTHGTGAAAITTRYTYDAAGRIKTTTKVGSNGGAILQSSNVYDTRGRLVSSTNALNHTTLYEELVDTGTGHVTRRTVLPDPDGAGPLESPVRDEVTYADGQHLETSGTAVHPVRTVHGVALDSSLGANGTHVRFTKEIRVGDGNAETEWTKSFVDPLGRPYKTEFPDGATSRQTYNSKGEVVKQVDPDGVTTLFRRGMNVEDASGLPDASDAEKWRGEWAVTAIDMNAPDGTMNFDGTDRISKTRSFVTKRDLGEDVFADVQRTIRTVWTTDGNSTATLDESLSDTSTDGLRSWSSQFRVGSTEQFLLNATSVTAYDSANRTVTTTGTAPDGTRQVSITIDGRLHSQATYFAPPETGAKRSEVVYSYDAHGRTIATTDTRATQTVDDDRTSTVAYNDGDQVVSTTSPAPDSNSSGQTTTNLYDNLGRVTQVTLPDTTVLHSEYFPTGETKKTWGSRAYPVEHTYDSQGRIKTLKTWQDFNEGTGSGTSGAATTTWNYDGQRGWLTSKQYNDGNGPSYEYNPSGMLKKRFWSQGRNITTTYTYDSAGTPSGIDYSDTTPDIAYTYDRRGRLVGVTDAVGTRTLSYGDAGEMLVEDFTSGVLDPVRVENHYDGLFRRDWNKLFVSNDLRNQVEFAYETATPRLSRVTKNSADSAEYAYDTHSDLIHTLTVKHGTTAVTVGTRAYDNIDRLTSISWHSTGVSDDSSAYTYNTANQRTRVDVGDGSYWLYTYDSMGQVVSGKRYFVDANGDIPVPGQQFEYTFDDIGNRTQTKVGGNEQGTGLRTASYTPNLLNQYAARDVPGSVDITGYSPASAVTVKANNVTYTTYRFGEYFQKLLTWVNTAVAKYVQVEIIVNSGTGETRMVFVPKTPEMFTYDPDGNLLSDGRWNYTWDGENHLISMETRAGLPSGLPLRRLQFVYDYMGRRNIKRVYKVAIPEVDPIPEGPEQNQGAGGIVPEEVEGEAELVGAPGTPVPPSPIWTLDSTVKYVWDGWNLLAELDGVNANIRTCAWGLDLSGSEQGAGGIGGLLFETDSAANTYHLTYDGNGNVRGLRDTTGAIAAAYEYGAFGETLTATGAASGSNPFRFSTKYTDAETGLLYFGLRYYGAGFGRWNSRDPAEEAGSVAIYTLLANEPANRVDPIGLWSWKGGARQGKSRAIMLPDAIDSVGSAAVFAGFDASDSAKWLRDDTTSKWVNPTDDIQMCDEYSVPNEVYVTTGDLSYGGWDVLRKSLAAMLGQINADNYADYMRADGYKIIRQGAVTKANILSIVGKQDIATWFIASHGALGVVWTGDPQVNGVMVGVTPDDILPGQHHRLSEAVLFVCEANSYSIFYNPWHRVIGWVDIVSERGLLWADPDYVFPLWTTWRNLDVTTGRPK